MSTLRERICKNIAVALFFTGSAISIFACSGGKGSDDSDKDPDIITEQSDSLVIIQSENGLRDYRFETPLMERYGNAREPYRKFPKGIYIETYADSVGTIESTLIADFAIQYEVQDLWFAQGNVVATNAKGQMLETQQLWWNRRTETVWSNVDSRVTQDGDVIVGEGFVSDDKFEEWEFRQTRGRIAVDVEPNRDTTASRTGPGEVGYDAGSDEAGDDRMEGVRPASERRASQRSGTSTTIPRPQTEPPQRPRGSSLTPATDAQQPERVERQNAIRENVAVPQIRQTEAVSSQKLDELHTIRAAESGER